MSIDYNGYPEGLQITRNEATHVSGEKSSHL